MRAVVTLSLHSSAGYRGPNRAGALKSYLLAPRHLTYRDKRSQGPCTPGHSSQGSPGHIYESKN